MAGLAGGCATPPGGPWGICGHFQTVPYLKRGGVRVVGPEDRGLEEILAALQVECFLRLGPAKPEPFLRLYG